METILESAASTLLCWSLLYSPKPTQKSVSICCVKIKFLLTYICVEIIEHKNIHILITITQQAHCVSLIIENCVSSFVSLMEQV
ncbi:CLUMA_CG003090, isoform A [Clunio marinus]|uniref:CLUMA_CG003090, isoform A n=1 Tax=Clunio marinus TaxID=568069 RepID=A0A1J1HMZ9_9DIPT|nr:CLUMA_CG003090, isoform A [Clunio marinus]